MSIRPLTQADLQWLVCPVCHNALHIEAGGVQCSGCSLLYPIVDGLPVLLASRGASPMR